MFYICALHKIQIRQFYIQCKHCKISCTCSILKSLISAGLYFLLEFFFYSNFYLEIFIFSSNLLPQIVFCRIGPVEIDPIEMTQLNNQLIPDLEKSDDSASDEEEDAFNWEWEAVSKDFY